MQKQINIGDILDQYGEDFIARNKTRGQEKGIINLLSACRSQAMGSHFERCDNCNYLGKAYNSCRNRHCPACQQKDKLQWLDKRMLELLPVGYYHLVFTIPHQVKNSLKSDYPPPKVVALTPIFASHREFFKTHMPFGQSPARTLPRLKDAGL